MPLFKIDVISVDSDQTRRRTRNIIWARIVCQCPFYGSRGINLYNSLGYFSRQKNDHTLLFFPQKTEFDVSSDNWSIGDNLHERSKPVFWEKMYFNESVSGCLPPPPPAGLLPPSPNDKRINGHLPPPPSQKCDPDICPPPPRAYF